MPSITFELETVTPLFLAGANQEEAELRPPAFRGALRYWFRAIAGGYYWNNINELKNIEASILGDTTESYGSSKVSIRLKYVSPSMRGELVSLTDKPGLKYLWFSMEMTNRQAIGLEEPVRFHISFQTRPIPLLKNEQQKNLLVIANCFWLAVNLGGFGSRERRGAGSLRVRQVNFQDLDETLFAKIPKFEIRVRPEDIPKYFKTEIRKIQRNCRELLNLETLPDIPMNQLPELEIYRQDIFKIYRITTRYTSWEAALEDIGNRYSSYRSTIPLSSRKVFGLPLTMVDMSSRRPSPLRIKIVKSVSDYYCFLSMAYADFPEIAGIKERNQFQTIDNFIQGLPNIERVI
jgi:CRISPR-associated protein Cmr1